MLHKLWLFTFLLILCSAQGKAQSPVIYLVGDTIDSLEVFSSWKEPGFVAVDADLNDIRKLVRIESNLNIKRLGSYTVWYKVTDKNGLQDSTHRIIHVVDQTAPVLQLIGSDTVSADIMAPYAELGVSVIDNYEKGIQATVTGSVNTSELGDYQLSYCAVDSSGNEATCIQRTVLVRDLSPPELSLIGPSFIRHPHCDSFIDPGYTVSDNYSKGLHVRVSGSWSPEKSGIPRKYHVRYMAIDTGGNIDTLSRTIFVVDKIAPTIQLIGPKYARVEQYYSYTDAGVTLSDSCNATEGLEIVTSGSYVSTRSAGLYYLKYHAIDSSLNSSDTVVRIINVHNMHDTMSVDQLAGKTAISVFPNPVRTEFRVQLSPEIVLEDVQILISNTSGEVISAQKIKEPTSPSITLQSSHLEPGCYFISLLIDSKMISRTRIIKL